MEVTNHQTIGAHFSVVIQADKNSTKWDHTYESARSALYSLLVTRRPEKIWLPNYICSAVLEAVNTAGVNVVSYQINENFEPEECVVIGPDDLILVVNYFGISAEMIRRQLGRFDPEKVIVDCSQAFFDRNFDCLASIYSARKFLPVPDGGGINCRINLPEVLGSNAESIARYQYLLGRVSEEPEVSRDAYIAAEHALSHVRLQGMSTFTAALIKSMDLDFIVQKRRENYLALCVLDAVNDNSIAIGDSVPLCYVFMHGKATKLRSFLIKNRVLTPKYWPDVDPMGWFECKLISDTVFLPIDHRYSVVDMQFIVSLVFNFIGDES